MLLDDYIAIWRELKGSPTPPRKGCRTLTNITELNYFVSEGILHCFDKNRVAHKYKPVDKIDPMESLDAWKEFNSAIARIYQETLKDRYGTLTKDLW